MYDLLCMSNFYPKVSSEYLTYNIDNNYSKYLSCYKFFYVSNQCPIE